MSLREQFCLVLDYTGVAMSISVVCMLALVLVYWAYDKIVGGDDK